MESYVVNLRRELHQHAEIGFDLPETLAILRRELDALGVPYTEQYGKSSIVATVNPEKSHFTIGVRADTDALPIEEQNDVPYRSCHKGIMHACGHDSHAAIVMETLRRVWAMREQIGCCVKFIFQAAEEYAPSGAMLMVKDGVMEDIDCIVGMHCDTNFPAGHLAITEGPQNATSDGFMLDFYGVSAHAARQHAGVDANVMALRAFMDIELMIAKEINAKKPVIFNVGAIHGGSANNIICDHCSMFCTLRTWEDGVAEYVLDKVKRIIEAVASTAGGSATFTLKKHYPIIQNDKKMTALFRAAGVKTVGEENMHENARGMGGEDFSYFANEKPGAFMRFGVRNEEKGYTIGVHNDRFMLDEDALEYGVRTFVQFILDNQNGIEF
ncbi:MAG: amidohydrolase [Ruminococcaceae bacterium]|nr:amidohydrolase [Oscillospiraceae bacterium]